MLPAYACCGIDIRGQSRLAHDCPRHAPSSCEAKQHVRRETVWAELHADDVRCCTSEDAELLQVTPVQLAYSIAFQ